MIDTVVKKRVRQLKERISYLIDEAITHSLTISDTNLTVTLYKLEDCFNRLRKYLK